VNARFMPGTKMKKIKKDLFISGNMKFHDEQI